MKKKVRLVKEIFSRNNQIVNHLYKSGFRALDATSNDGVRHNPDFRHLLSQQAQSPGRVVLAGSHAKVSLVFL